MSAGPIFDSLAQQYERFADIHDGFYRPWLTQAIPDRSDNMGQAVGSDGPLTNRYGPDNPSRALDLGCGSGRFTELLADRYAEVLAVDVSAEELAIAKRKRDRPNICYYHGSMLDVTPERDSRFDLVLSVNAIHHLRDHDRVLPHIRNLVAPGGVAVLVDIVQVSRRRHSPWWHRKEAVADAARVAVRHKSLGKAADVLRLRLHPRWLEHVTTNIPLTRADFHSTYASVFPGAEFNDDISHIVAAVRWQAPGRAAL